VNTVHIVAYIIVYTLGFMFIVTNNTIGEYLCELLYPFSLVDVKSVKNIKQITCFFIFARNSCASLNSHAKQWFYLHKVITIVTDIRYL